MNEEQNLRDRLESINVPATRLDVDALVRDGRRRAFRRRSAQAAGGVALGTAMLLAVPSVLIGARAQPAVPSIARSSSTPTAPTTSPAGPCKMTTLPVPSGMKQATATAVDPTGRYIVGNSLAGQDFRPILWTDGRAKALHLIGKSVQVTAVNASGIAVGLVEEPQQEYIFRYENGAYTKLNMPSGRWHPYPAPAINTAGDIVINAEPWGNSGGKGTIVLLWKAGSRTPIKLPLPAEASVHAITDDGTLVGGIYKDGVGIAAYTWDQQGHGRRLESLKGQTALAYAAQGDWATGGLWPSMSAALWNLTTGKMTQLKSGDKGPGDAVNASGWVVVGGTVLRDGAPITLAAPDGQTSHAADVSDTGMIVGQTSTNNADETVGPRVWRC